MEVSASLIRRGSSTSGNCSAISPASDQERPESEESEEYRRGLWWWEEEREEEVC